MLVPVGAARRACLAIALFLGAHACLSCTSPATELVVVVTSDLAVPDELDAVDLTVIGGGSRTRTLTVQLVGGSRVDLPLTLGVIPKDDPTAEVTVTAIGLHGSDEVVRQSTTTHFVEEQSLTLVLRLLRSCRGARCETGETCDAEGCRDVITDPSALPRWTGRVPDAGVPDSGCPPEIDTSSDPLNCGTCGNVCPSVGGAAATCEGGVCGSSCEPGFHPCADGCQPDDSVVACGPSCTRCPDAPGSAATCDGLACGIRCDPGFADCDTDAGTGCERDVRTSLDCGDCDVACRPPTALCGEVDGSPACVSSCAADETQCGDACVDVMTDPRHCGACDNACPVPEGGAAACAGGRCGLACDEGFHACGTECVSDSSPATCGTRCAPCPEADGATTTCRLGECGFLCMTGRGDCDDAVPGCETDVTSSVAHCGDCGMPCALPFAVSDCRSGVCVVASCEAGHDNCDATAPGCETDTTSSAIHCGACGHTCGAGYACTMGVCMDDPIAVAAGLDHTCALLAGGQVFCWGDNTFGQLGGTPGATGLAQVEGLVDAVEIELGDQTSCARRATGEVVCWGRGDLGQLGDGRTGTGVQSPAPLAVAGVGNAVSIAVGRAFACATLMDAGVLCWGDDTSGQLGDGMSGPARGTPMPVAAVTDSVSVSAGGAHACSRSRAGNVSCWGLGTSGQLGDGMMLDSAVPVAVGGIAGSPGSVSGDAHTCSADATTVRCWGNNAHGQLGDGTIMSSPTPVAVTSPPAMPIGGTAGGDTSCLVARVGTVVCWGAGDRGQLGIGEIRAAQAIPVMVGALTDARFVACGTAHCCAVRATSELVCWGANDSGQLGIGSSGDALEPAPVLGLP